MARGGAGVRETAPMKFIILFFGSARGRFGIRRGSCFLFVQPSAEFIIFYQTPGVYHWTVERHSSHVAGEGHNTRVFACWGSCYPNLFKGNHRLVSVEATLPIPHRSFG